MILSRKGNSDNSSYHFALKVPGIVHSALFILFYILGV